MLCGAGTLEWDTRSEGGRDTQGMSQYMTGLGLVPYLRPPGWANRRGADHWMCLFFQTYIHIVNQRTGKPVSTKFYTDPMVVFHHINAYEEDGCLLFDVIAYKDSSLYDCFYLANLKQGFEGNSRIVPVPTLKRFAVPLCMDKVMA